MTVIPFSQRITQYAIRADEIRAVIRHESLRSPSSGNHTSQRVDERIRRQVGQYLKMYGSYGQTGEDQAIPLNLRPAPFNDERPKTIDTDIGERRLSGGESFWRQVGHARSLRSRVESLAGRTTAYHTTYNRAHAWDPEAPP